MAIGIDVEQHTFCLETLANGLRLDIMRLLSDEHELSVTGIARRTGAERSRVSHALSQLKECHLVTAEKKGREMKYRLDEETPLFRRSKGNIFEAIEEHVRTRCPTCRKAR